jgi:hypothetical protein
MGTKTAKRRQDKATEAHRVATVAEYSIAMRKLLERFPDARTVVDAKEDKMLLITDGDVRAGTPKNPAECAVAQCARRSGFGGMIGRNFAYLIHGTEVTRYVLGKDAQVRTAVFDERGTMTSGPVVLGAVPPSQQLREMGRRERITRTQIAKRKKAVHPQTRMLRDRADRVRKAIVSYGNRSWAQA